MKTFYFLLFFLALTIGTSFAQRIVYVDTDYVLDQLPEYHQAKEELQSFTEQWSQEISEKETELLNLKVNYKEKELLLPEVDKIELEAKITHAENNLADLKRNRFGVKGDLFKKQQDLIKPIQDRIYNAIKQMAEFRNYDLVLDKSTGVSILFAKPDIDMSEEVLRIVLNKK